jgi:agmatine deiminase
MTISYDGTPAADGFHMPAEWAPHDGCWMIWPERQDTWRLGAKPVQEQFTAVAAAIAAGGDPVTMAVSQRQFDHARGVLPPEVRVVEMTSDDAWMRDVGPTFVVDGRGGRRGVDWIFNAWGGVEGGLYWPWQHDDAVAAKVLEIERAGRHRAPLVLEGGSIHVDGEGTVLTTEECLLNHNRNPSLTRERIEELLHAYLGIEKVLWLGPGTFNDETDGHVDNICCFAAPGVVLLHWTDDVSDPQHAISADALDRLERMTDARGRSLTVHKVPMPGPLELTAEEAAGIDPVGGAKLRLGGDRLAGSYVNFYIANERVVMPLLDERTDDEAREILAGVFPGREVVGVPAREILLGGGNIHCITQQVPTA